MQTSKWYPLYKFDIYVGDVEPQTPTLSIDPVSLQFNEDGESKEVRVTITNQSDASYSVTGLPSWLTVGNKTQTGFTLTADPSDTDMPRSVTLTVKSDAYPGASASLSVTQEGAWLSEFVFDVKTTAINQDIPRLFCMAAEESGEAQINWGEKDANGKDITETVTVNPPTDVQLTDQQGNHFTVKVGEDFTHTYATAGQRKVTVKVRKGVNVFRFSSIKEGATEDWGATYLPNPYITTIRKILSPSLTSGYKMFAGVVNGSFASDWDGLETPNMTDFDFMFENFGSNGSGTNGAFTSADRMQFPKNMYQNITHKDQVHKLNRTYYGSGFEKIEKSMLSCAADNALTSVFETFRQMRNVGGNWVSKYAPGGLSPDGSDKLLEEFVKNNLFDNQPNIHDFTGCFNAINDNYGNYTSGYSYKWFISKDFFKTNKGSKSSSNYDANHYLILDAMFNKATRAVLGTGFFADIAQNVRSMYLCFHAFNDGNPRISYGAIIPNANGADLNAMFPDASYPNMGKPIDANDTIARHMAGAFDFRGDGDTEIAGNPPDQYRTAKGIGGGFQCLPFGSLYSPNQRFNTDFNFSSENLRKNNFNIQTFLQKFPNVTATSGIDPRDNTKVIDGAAYNFGNYTGHDFNANDGNSSDNTSNVQGADQTQQVQKAGDVSTFASSHPTRAKVTGTENLN